MRFPSQFGVNGSSQKSDKWNQKVTIKHQASRASVVQSCMCQQCVLYLSICYVIDYFVFIIMCHSRYYGIMTYSSFQSQHPARYLTNNRYTIYQKREKYEERQEKAKKGKERNEGRQEDGKLKRKVWRERRREKGKFRLVFIFIAVVNDCRQILFLKSSRKEYHIIFPNNIFQRVATI